MSFLSDIENMDGFPEVPSDAFSAFDLDNINSMSCLSDIKNMDGFPEVPSDAFSAFDLDNIQPKPLTRTYKAVCPMCLGRAYTTMPNNFFSYCYTCTFDLIPFLQSIVRGYLVRQKLKRLKTVN